MVGILGHAGSRGLDLPRIKGFTSLLWTHPPPSRPTNPRLCGTCNALYVTPAHLSSADGQPDDPARRTVSGSRHCSGAGGRLPERRSGSQSEQVLPLVEETATVHKREVVTGKVRVRTITDTLEELAQATLQSESVEVTRVPDRPGGGGRPDSPDRRRRRDRSGSGRGSRRPEAARSQGGAAYPAAGRDRDRRGTRHAYASSGPSWSVLLRMVRSSTRRKQTHDVRYEPELFVVPANGDRLF